MRVLRGVVYMTKSSGPRTEPWGTPQEDVYQQDRSVSHFTRKQRDDRYDLNQLRTEPWIPNQDERQINSCNEFVDYVPTLVILIMCKGPSVQLPLSPKFAVKKSLTNSIRASPAICIEFRSFVPKELDMNLTSLKVEIHRHCSINKLN